MSTQKTFGRHAQSKTPRALTRVSAAVTVTGGLVAGLAATGGSPAGAAPTTPQQEAVKAATTPLELKTVTPAKSLVAKQAKAAAATKKTTVKKTSRTQARQALTQRDERATQTLAVQRKAAQERVSRRGTTLWRVDATAPGVGAALGCTGKSHVDLAAAVPSNASHAVRSSST